MGTKFSEKRIKAHAFLIGDSGHIPEEFLEVDLPPELRGPSPQELYEWMEFDLELQEKIRKGELYVDPKTGEVRQKHV